MQEMPIRVRRFVPSDQSQCRAVILEGLAEHFGFIDESRNPDLNDIQGSYLAVGNDFYVALVGGQVVGTVGLLFEPGRARIVRMSVAKLHRKQGIATALLNKCMAAARKGGLPELVAFTEPHWSDAVGFYTASGFKQLGMDEEDIHLGLRVTEIQLNALERTVLTMILAGDDPVLATLRAQFEVAIITEREYTGHGFFTDFSVADTAPRTSPPGFVVSDVFGTITEKNTQVGFLLFVRDGVPMMLEGFTYRTDEWSVDAQLVEAYYMRTDHPLTIGQIQMLHRCAVRDIEQLRASWRGLASPPP